MKYFRRERHTEGYLFKLLRTDETVAAVTNNGFVLAVKDTTVDFTDDEWLELMMVTSKVSESIKGKSKKSEIYYSLSEGFEVKLICLEAGKREGQQYANVELQFTHRWRGKRGEVVLWLWQDLLPIAH